MKIANFPMFQAELQIPLSGGNLSILLGIEYKFQHSTLKSLPENDYYELIEDNNRIGVKFGVLFN
jgi:hypothetical protein